MYASLDPGDRPRPSRPVAASIAFAQAGPGGPARTWGFAPQDITAGGCQSNCRYVTIQFRKHNMYRALKIIVVAALLACAAGAAVKVEKVNYAGWPNCYKVSNGEVELIVTGDVGPRIIRFGFAGGQNLLKEFPEQL